MIVTFEGRMGSGKSLSSVGMAYTEWLKREILIAAINAVLKDMKWDKAVEYLKTQFSVSDKVAANELTTAIRIFEEEGEEAYRPSIKVFSNNHLNFPYTHFDPQYLIDHMEDEELTDCILILDEAFQIIDARTSSKNVTKLFTYFLGQTRKRRVDLYVCTHHIDEVDKRLRRKPDIRGTCRFNKGPLEPEKPIKKRRWNWAKVMLRDLRYGSERTLWFYGPAFWSLYDTTERIPMMRRQLADIEL